MELTDEILGKVAAGDSAGIAVLIRWLELRARGQLRRAGLGEELVRTVVGETLVEVYRSLPGYKSQQKPEAWVWRIFARTTMRIVKDEVKRRRELVLDAPPGEDETPLARLVRDVGPGPAGATEISEFLRALAECYHALSPLRQETIALRVMFDLPSKTVAQIMGDQSHTAVDKRMFDAKTAMEKCLAAKGFDTRISGERNG